MSEISQPWIYYQYHQYPWVPQVRESIHGKIGIPFCSLSYLPLDMKCWFVFCLFSLLKEKIITLGKSCTRIQNLCLKSPPQYFQCKDFPLKKNKEGGVIPSCPLSVVVVNFSHFHGLLQNHWTNFNQTWHKASLDEGIQVCSNEEPFNSHTVDNGFFFS